MSVNYELVRSNTMDTLWYISNAKLHCGWNVEMVVKKSLLEYIRLHHHYNLKRCNFFTMSTSTWSRLVLIAGQSVLEHVTVYIIRKGEG